MRWSPITAFAERDPDCGEIPSSSWRQRSLAMGSIWGMSAAIASVSAVEAGVC